MFTPSIFAPIVSGSWTISRVPASATPVLLLSGSSFGRREAAIYNHGSGSLYIAPVPNVSVNYFAAKIGSGSYYEMPIPTYQGEVYGIWDAANGWAMISDKQSGE